MSKRFVVIGIDDLHPETSRGGEDCGGDLSGGKLDLLQDFSNKYKKIKINLFLTPNWRFKEQFFGISTIQNFLYKYKFNKFYNLVNDAIRSWPENKFNILNPEFEEWRNKIRAMVRSGNFYIGIHGLYHMGPAPPYAAEFKYLDQKETVRRLNEALNTIKQSGISFEMGFAPPGWGIGKHLLNVLSELNFKYIAGIADFKTKIERKAKIKMFNDMKASLLYPQFVVRELVNIPRNWSLGFSTIDRAIEILENDGILGIHGHMENEYEGCYLGNGITSKNLSKLEDLLINLEMKYGEELIYVSFGELADHFLNLKSREKSS